jgi:PAS domain S-box-containing protein
MLPGKMQSSLIAALQILLDGGPEPLVVTDEDGRIVCANAKAELRFGHRRSDLLGAELARLLAERRGRENQHQQDHEGALLRLEALLDVAPAVIVAISKSGVIEYINRVLPQYNKSDTIGTQWLSYFAEEHRGIMQTALQAVLESGAQQTYETSTAGPEGKPVWYSSQIGPLRREGEVVGAVLVSQDITEMKQAQHELLAARRLASLGTLAAGVAHEINTPIQFVGDSLQFLRNASQDLLRLVARLQVLRAEVVAGGALQAAIVGSAEAEAEADLPYLRENVSAAFDRCQDGLGRVSAIVRSLRDFAHPSGKEMAPIDLKQAIRSTLTIAANEYKYVAELETDLADTPAVVCFGGEINQVILNIVVNAAHAIADAVKGTDRKGVLSVRTRCDGDDVVIAIGDTGGGIPADVQAHIYDPFFTTKEVGKGTGQGLALAWNTVIEQHGGALTFETSAASGTTFFIRLPIMGKGTSGSAPGRTRR